MSMKPPLAERVPWARSLIPMSSTLAATKRAMSVVEVESWVEFEQDSKATGTAQLHVTPCDIPQRGIRLQ
eukprot:687720-Prymnesium_polylepis.3